MCLLVTLKFVEKLAVWEIALDYATQFLEIMAEYFKNKREVTATKWINQLQAPYLSFFFLRASNAILKSNRHPAIILVFIFYGFRGRLA